MALPTLIKSYQFHVNQAYPANGSAIADNRALLLGARDGLKGNGSGWTDSNGSTTTPTNCWTTRYSCDSVTAGTAGDGVDRWTGQSALVWGNAGTQVHSWHVFRQDALGTFDLLLSLEGGTANGNIMTAAVSPSAGFTGGTTTTRPTATDEIVLLNNTNWNFGTDSSAVLNVVSSTDGQVTM